MPPQNAIQVAMHACHSDRYMHVTRIDASMSLGSRHVACHHMNQSKLPCMHVTRIDTCMSLGSMQACHSDRGMLHATTKCNPSCQPSNQSKLPCMHVTRIDASMSLGSRHVACHHKMQSKLLPCMHVTRIDTCMSLELTQACHSDRGM
jgi:hypothetical protein